MKFKVVPILLLSLSLLNTGCSAVPKEPISYTGIALDTVVSVQIYDSQDKSLLEECQKICEKYEKKLSRTIETSEIAQINSADGKPVQVSDETIELIETGLYYGDLSDGAFDITIGTVSSLWDFKTENPIIPSPELLSDAVSHIDYKKVKIDGNTVQLLDNQVKLDLGAIAKGYIADQIKDYLQQEGVKHALINLGGNVLAVGNKMDGSDFHIGIQTPFDTNAEPITAVDLNDQSAVTSGTYQRYFEKDGKLYHHILSPIDGMPCNNGLNSVTIVTDSSLTADALSTTCFLLGPEKGMELINHLDHTEAIFIDTNNQIFYSEHLK